LAFPENLRKEHCVLTEGVFDALSFIKVGIHACGLLGTNPGEDARERLAKANAKLYFCMDPDKAGEAAAYKLAREVRGYILELGSDKDPDETLAELGPEKFKAVIDKGIKEAMYYLDAVIEREEISEALMEIAKLKMASEQDGWLKKLAAKYGVTVRSLRKDMKSMGTEKESSSFNEITLVDPKPRLHPAMDILDGKLIFGTYNGVKPFYLCNRELIVHSNLLSKFAISDEPQHLRFSSQGIRDYLEGKEVNGPDLYQRIHDLLVKHLIFRSSWQVVLCTIWIIGTYLHRCFSLYPYLWVQSPTMRCGKTRLLEIVSELAFNSDGIQTAPTQAVLYRVPTITAGTLCWDEAENLHNHKEKGERLEILNAAYRKSSKIPRCDGEDNKVKFFEVYRPIILAGINSLPGTVADRSIKIELIRKNRDENVARLQTDRMQDELQSLRDDLHIFALEKMPAILTFYSEFREDLIPEGVDDRLRDALEIIFSIGAGIYYPDGKFPLLSLLKDAARDLSGIRESEEDEVSFIRAICILLEEFQGQWGDEVILTSKEAMEIFQAGGIDWVQEPKHAKGILKKLGIRSEPHRINGKLVRGYKVQLSTIKDLSERYEGGISEKKAYKA
ncbi:MAG: toprim domain-containing protein, partial [Thermodesulfobacteriota bacterium]